jgi:hypothetical protein
MNRRIVITAVAGVMLLTGCQEHGTDGDPGKVIYRESEYHKSSKTWDYDLVIERPDGSTYEIDVSSGVYDHCYRGSAYPKCVER